MSWQEYVDQHLVGTGKISRAAIIGQKGGVWAKCPADKGGGPSQYPIEQNEQAIIHAFEDQGKILASGIKIAGEKYFVINVESNTIFGKKQADGCILVKTNTAILVAEYVSPTQAAEAATIVGKLGDYLSSVGY